MEKTREWWEGILEKHLGLDGNNENTITFGQYGVCLEDNDALISLKDFIREIVRTEQSSYDQAIHEATSKLQ